MYKNKYLSLLDVKNPVIPLSHNSLRHDECNTLKPCHLDVMEIGCIFKKHHLFKGIKMEIHDNASIINKFTRVTVKGQATIPVHIREYLNLDKGDYIAYEITPDGRVVLAKANVSLSFNQNETTTPLIKPKNIKEKIDHGSSQ